MLLVARTCPQLIFMKDMLEFWKNPSNGFKWTLAGIALLAAVMTGILFYPNSSQEILLPNELAQISVYVTGAVEHPGVYTLPHGSRVNDLLKRAVPKKEWDATAINLAKRLEDEDMIVVPKLTHQKIFPLFHAPAKKLAANQSVSLNQASIAEFQTLPGIGPGMAKRIVDYRTAHGSFGSIEDLQDVPGMGGKKFQRVKPFLRL